MQVCGISPAPPAKDALDGSSTLLKLRGQQAFVPPGAATAGARLARGIATTPSTVTLIGRLCDLQLRGCPSDKAVTGEMRAFSAKEGWGVGDVEYRRKPKVGVAARWPVWRCRDARSR